MVNCTVWVSRSSSSVCVCVHSSEICRWCVWRMIYHEGRVLTGTSAFQHWWDYSTMMIHMCVYMWVCCRPRWGADLWAHLSVFFVLMYPAVVTVGRRNRQEFWSLLSVKKKMQIVLCLESEDSQFYFFSISNWMSLGFGLSVSQNRQFSCGLKCSQVHATRTQFSCFRDKSIGSSVKLQSHNWKQDCWDVVFSQGNDNVHILIMFLFIKRSWCLSPSRWDGSWSGTLQSPMTSSCFWQVWEWNSKICFSYK